MFKFIIKYLFYVIKNYRKSFVSSFLGILLGIIVTATTQLIMMLNQHTNAINSLAMQEAHLNNLTDSRLDHLEGRMSKVVQRDSFNDYIRRKDHEYEQQNLINNQLYSLIGNIQGKQNEDEKIKEGCDVK